jgi:hypothetical protein
MRNILASLESSSSPEEYFASQAQAIESLNHEELKEYFFKNSLSIETFQHIAQIVYWQTPHEDRIQVFNSLLGQFSTQDQLNIIKSLINRASVETKLISSGDIEAEAFYKVVKSEFANFHFSNNNLNRET